MVPPPPETPSLDELLPIAYRELREVAAGYLRREVDGHTLQPTALVHEVVLRLLDQPDARFRDRQHLVAVCAQAMRRILVDHARRRRAQKRDGGVRVPLLPGLAGPERDDDELLAVDEALDALRDRDERIARVVELRYFAGFGITQAAELLGVSPATVKRDWTLARAFLHRALNPAANDAANAATGEAGSP